MPGACFVQARVMIAEARLFGPLIKAIAPFANGPAGGLNHPYREHKNGSARGAKLTPTERL